MENHSKTTSCMIYWTIIRPIQNQEENDEGEEEGEEEEYEDE